MRHLSLFVLALFLTVCVFSTLHVAVGEGPPAAAAAPTSAPSTPPTGGARGQAPLGGSGGPAFTRPPQIPLPGRGNLGPDGRPLRTPPSDPRGTRSPPPPPGGAPPQDDAGEIDPR